MKRFLMIIVSTALAAIVMVALARGMNASSTASAQTIQSAAPAAVAQVSTADPAQPSALANDQHPNDGSHAGGQVSAVSGSTISVTTRDGSALDILTTASTTVELDGSASSLSAIAAGQFVMAEGATDANGVFTASAIHASTTQPQGRPGDRGHNDGDHAGGQVSAVSGSTISVTTRDGSALDILTTASTTVELDGSASSLSAIAAGQFVMAEGATDANGVFTASAIHASTTQPQGRPGDRGHNDGDHAGGQVSAVSGSTISVTTRDGSALDILTTASTTVELDGSASSLSAIAAGQFVMAEGATDANGVFTASAIHASTTQPQGRPGDGHGPRGPRP